MNCRLPILSRVYALFTLPAILLACGLLGPTAADAQITNEVLIGKAVSNPNQHPDVEKAIGIYGEGDPTTAKLYLEQAKKKDPKLPPVAVMMARLHQLSGNANRVRGELDACIDEAPDDPEPYLILAEDANRNGRTIEADALFDKAVTLIESFDANAKRKRDFQIRAYVGRTAIAQRRRKWDQAVSDLKKVINVDPDNPQVHTAMGQVLFMMDPPKEQEGLAAFQKAQQLGEKEDKKVDHYYVAAGKTLSGQGKNDKAMTYYDAAFKAAPNEEGVQLAYAQALLMSGDVPKAEPVLKKAIAANPDSAGLHLLMGVAARMKGDLATAEQQLVQTIGISPTFGTAYEQLAQILIESSDKEDQQRAVQFAVTAQKLAPKNASSNVTLAWCFYKTDNARQGTTILKNTQFRNMDPDASFLLAKILKLNKQMESAKKMLNVALEDKRHIFVNRAEAKKLLETM